MADHHNPHTEIIPLKDLVALIDPESVPTVAEKMRLLFAGELEEVDQEVPMILRTGERRWIRNRARVTERDADGRPLMLQGVDLDITGHRADKERLGSERYLLLGVLQTSTTAITVMDSSGRILMANDAAEEVLGMSLGDLRKRTYRSTEWEHTDASGTPIPHSRLAFPQVMSTGKPLKDFEESILRPDGTRRLLRIDGAPVRDPQGKITAVVFSLSDITQQRQREAERQLREINQSLAARVAGLHHWVWDLEDDSLQWSDSVFLLFGLTRSALQSWKAVFSVVDPEDRQSTWEALQEGVRSGTLPPTEFRIRHLDGTQRFLRALGTMSYDSNGSKKRLVGAILDITSERRTEEELRTSLQRLKAISDNLPEGAVFRFEIDNDRRASLPYISRGIRQLLGYSSDELIANPAILRELLVQDDARLAAELESSIIEKGANLDALLRFRSRSGDIHWLSFQAAATPLARGGLAWDGIVVDETRRIRAEESRSRTQRFVEAILQHMPAMVYVFDDEDRFIYANQAANQYFGGDSGSVIGSPFRQLAKGDGCEEFLQNNRIARREGGVLTTVEECRAYAETRYFHSIKFPLGITPLGVPGLCGISIEITDQYRSRAAIAESEERFRNLSDSAPVLIWVSEANGDISYYNKPWFEFVGHEDYESGESWKNALVDPLWTKTGPR